MPDPSLEAIVEAARKRWPDRGCKVKCRQIAVRENIALVTYELWTEGWAFEQQEFTACDLPALMAKLKGEEDAT